MKMGELVHKDLIGKKFRHYRTLGVYEVLDVPEYTGDDAEDKRRRAA